MTVHVVGMDILELTARPAAITLGITPGSTVTAIQWDGTEQAASDIVEWVAAAGGIASQNGAYIYVADSGDVSAAAPSDHIARLADGSHTVLGAVAIATLFDPARTLAGVTL